MDEEQLATRMKALEDAIRADNDYTVEVSGSAKITSSNLHAPLSSRYYHDIMIQIAGATSSDVKVYVDIVTSQAQTTAVYLMNTTVTKLKLYGVKVTQIYADSTLSTASLYVDYIGYDRLNVSSIDV